MNKDEIYIDLDFGEVVYVKATGIKSIQIDSNYTFTIYYTDGTSQKVPTLYRDFVDILNQLKAQNTKGDEFIKNSNSVMNSVSESASAADTSAKSAAASAEQSKKSADASASSAAEAKTHETNAGNSATASANFATNSAASEKNAASSAESARQSAETAAGYAGAAVYSLGINPNTGHMAVFYNGED